ncbi:hypothetical protein TrLO_g7636 [Triparma laevis f. longispina]|uniref:PNPLA domain-containing protein n=1 Tax=Triparma laevis f. longispina TaxID=1714387 RepID=A0A9W7KWE2_9STRA|nr:hypothetical protein TrLO_g7636 [Triparma laevis f. longispina]
MASSIALLNLCNTFDSIYGSSAGSIIGAYMISRQMCVDVYSSILVGNRLFLQKPDLIKFAARASVNSKSKDNYEATGMNISYVLKDVMSAQGLRPFDFDAFIANVEGQPLYVLSSGENFTQGIFGAEDFFDTYSEEQGVKYATRSKEDDPRGLDSGFFSCLASSMVVPGAGGKPISLSKNGEEPKMYCDAFVYEAVPIRAPVYHSNATHVMILRTRPSAAPLKTVPGFYETKIGKYYFDQWGMEDVAEWYAAGGQQFRYLEEVACTSEGLLGSEVKIPPMDVVYARPNLTWEEVRSITDTTKWRSAYVLPLMVDQDIAEMSPLEQKEKVVVQGIRDGFVAGYEAMKDAAGATLPDGMTSSDLADLLFPFREDYDPRYDVKKPIKPEELQTVYVKGKKISEITKKNSILFKKTRKRGRIKSVISKLYRKMSRLLRRRESRETVDEKWEKIKLALPAVEDFPHLARQIKARLEQEERDLKIIKAL